LGRVPADVSRSLGLGDPRVGAATVGAAALVAQQVVGKALRDTLFLEAFGVERLPYAMIAGAAVSGAVVVGLSRAASAHTPRRVAPGALGLSALLFLLAWGVQAFSPPLAAAITWLQAGALSAGAVSVFWSLVADSFDPYSARASVPRIMAGATLGGVLGGLVTWRAAGLLHSHDLLPFGAALNLAAVAAVTRLGGGGAREDAPEPEVPRGWRPLLRELPYLRAVALLVLAAAVTQSFLDWLLSSAAVSSFGTGPQLLSFFALFQTAVGVLSFLLQIGVSRSALERFGVGFALAAAPALLLAGCVAATFSTPLAAAVILRGADGVLGASLHRSAYEVLFAPLEARKRRASKPLLDVGFDRAGTLAGAAVVAAVLAVAPARAWPVLLAGVAVLAVLRLALSPWLQAGYRGSLADSLRHGAAGLSRTAVLDPGTIAALSRASVAGAPGPLPPEVARLHAGQERSDEPDGARLAIAAFDLPVCPELCGGTEAPDDPVLALAELRSGDGARIGEVLARRRTDPLLAPQVIALLGDDRVARDAADWLVAQEPPPIGLLGDALLSDRLSEHARRRVARILGKLDDPRAAEALVVALPSVPTRVRPGLAHALGRAAARAPLPREPILAAARRAAEESPAGGRASLEEIFALLEAAYPREPVRRALRALERGGDARGTALEWLDVVLPPDVKLALWPRIVRSGERIAPSARRPDELRDALAAGTGSE
jgi:hypothetical protein